jgi:hypothetical protein
LWYLHILSIVSVIFLVKSSASHFLFWRSVSSVLNMTWRWRST